MSRDLTSTLKVAAVPVVGVLALAFAWTHHPHGLGFIVLLAILMAAVLTAVSHAEVIAQSGENKNDWEHQIEQLQARIQDPDGLDDWLNQSDPSRPPLPKPPPKSPKK